MYFTILTNVFYDALAAIRDYSYNYAHLTYLDYAPGILTGCNITAHGGEMVISPGVLKYEDRILLLSEPEQISYIATNAMQYLKVHIEVEDASPEFIIDQVTFILEQAEECKENEMELCRFHLRQGAEQRYQYKDFSDLDTEYDTINQIFAVWGGKGGQTLPPFITDFFAEEILNARLERE